MKSVEELKSIRGKTVLVRVDFNVHIERGHLGDDTKIVAAVPTIELLLKKGAKVILMSHFGRPKSKGSTAKAGQAGVRDLSADKADQVSEIVVKRLNELLKKKVALMEKWNFERIAEQVEKMKPSTVLMLPNLRLHQGEEKNSVAFAKELAQLGAVYVNEAFGVDHRTHASLVGVPKCVPSYAGLQLMKEVEVLSKVLHAPQKPLVVLMGGGKITDKMAMLTAMVKKADVVLLGGALATHLYKAMGYGVGSSRIEPEGVRLAKKLMGNKKIILPKDVVVGKENGEGARVVEVSTEQQNNRTTGQHRVICEKSYSIWDIGPKTILEYAKHIKVARTLIWNGPVGLYEVKRFSHGTFALGRLFAARSKGKAFGKRRAAHSADS